MAWQPNVNLNRNPMCDNKQESNTAISVNCQEGRSVSSTYHRPRPSLFDPPPAPRICMCTFCKRPKMLTRATFTCNREVSKRQHA